MNRRLFLRNTALITGAASLPLGPLRGFSSSPQNAGWEISTWVGLCLADRVTGEAWLTECAAAKPPLTKLPGGHTFSDQTPLLKLTGPCGEVVEYRTSADVPRNDVPCPCGNPRHWMVKWGAA